jgi:hypothetical protein
MSEAVARKKYAINKSLAERFFPWTLGRKYLLINFSFLIFYLVMLLADAVGLYEMFWFVRHFCYFSLLLFIFNISVFFISLANRMIRVLMVPQTPPTSPLAKSHPSSFVPSSQRIGIDQSLSPHKRIPTQTQSTLIKTPIKLLSTPRGSSPLFPASSSQLLSTPALSTPLSQSTPFSLKLSVANASVPSVVPTQTITRSASKIGPVFRGEKIPEIIQPDSGKKIKLDEFRIVKGDLAFRNLSLSHDRMDSLVENLRHWFTVKIFKPLARNIAECEEYFYKAGWGHLGPSRPAVYSLLSKGNNNVIPSWESGFILPNTFISKDSPRVDAPQSLLELAQRYREDPMVFTRLAIEKYLDTGNSVAGHRITTIQHIGQWASDPWIRQPILKDANPILIHLFCTFLDEKLQFPASNRSNSDLDFFTGSHSKNFVALGEPVGSFAAQTPKLHQVRLQEFRVLLPNHTALEVPLGINHVFQVIVLFLEYIRVNLNGFLGIANLASSSIDLMEVLKEEGRYFK